LLTTTLSQLRLSLRRWEEVLEGEMTRKEGEGDDEGGDEGMVKVEVEGAVGVKHNRMP
jgi:hypothetical protein